MENLTILCAIHFDMEQYTFLYTLPQWFIFAGVIAFGYGWVEKKRPFSIIGIFIFIALGIFALYLIAQDYFVFHNYLTPDEIIDLEFDDQIIEEMPITGKILPAYWMFVVSGAFAIPALILEWKRKKLSRTIMIISGLIALSGFFIIVSALRM